MTLLSLVISNRQCTRLTLNNGLLTKIIFPGTKFPKFIAEIGIKFLGYCVHESGWTIAAHRFYGVVIHSDFTDPAVNPS